MIVDLLNPNTNPLPDEAQQLVAALLDGRVRSMFLVAEIEESDGSTAWLEGSLVNMDEHQSDIRAFIGSITLNLDELKQDVIDGLFTDDDEDEASDSDAG